jgi:uncharacterized protein (DUF1778 family)
MTTLSRSESQAGSVFELSAERWVELLQALDAPPRDLPRVKALFSKPSVFEHETKD